MTALEVFEAKAFAAGLGLIISFGLTIALAYLIDFIRDQI